MTEPFDPTDPLTVLRADVAPVEPDADFAGRLRARLERALTDPEAPMSITDEAPTALASTATAAFTPYLAVADARAAIDWYVASFDAAVVGEPIVMPDARIGHAELTVAGARLFLSDEHPEIGVAAPQPGAGASVTLHLELDDPQAVDRFVDSARQHGATIEREPADSPYGRQAVIRDPAGHRWMFMAALAPAVAASPVNGEPIRQGDVVHASVWTPDPGRARAFYTAVLGWSVEVYDPVRQQVIGQSMTLSIAPTDGRPTLFCSYAVDDLDDAVQRVRTAGGSADEPKPMPWGRSAMCTDPAGRTFALWENDGSQPRPPVNGRRAGDLAYITMSVDGDSEPIRRFFSEVLGWEFRAGRVDDGWEPADVAPMTGLAGGQDSSVVTPMWRVDDIAAAVERVRAAGGTATEPEQQPYALTAECTDDQGTPFYLGQM